MGREPEGIAGFASNLSGPGVGPWGDEGTSGVWVWSQPSSSGWELVQVVHSAPGWPSDSESHVYEVLMSPVTLSLRSLKQVRL